MQKLLLLHGALGSTENFGSLKIRLKGHFEIHTLNFGGHGGQEITGTLTISGFAAEIINYLKENDIERISIFGYSMGGYVGLYLCRHYPEMVEKLFTLATKLNWTPGGAANESAMLNPEIIKQKVPKYALALQQLHGYNWEGLLKSTAEMMIALGKDPVIKPEHFGEINTPVLLAVGDKDEMVTIEETAAAFRVLKKAGMMVLPFTPHSIEKADLDELSHQIRNYFL